VPESGRSGADVADATSVEPSQLQPLVAAAASIMQHRKALAEALCTQFPLTCCCNNPGCTELRGASELQLVGGKGCVPRCRWVWIECMPFPVPHQEQGTSITLRTTQQSCPHAADKRKPKCPALRSTACIKSAHCCAPCHTCLLCLQDCVLVQQGVPAAALEGPQASLQEDCRTGQRNECCTGNMMPLQHHALNDRYDDFGLNP
jgi:hypothetical protein